MNPIATYIDHTILKPTCSVADIEKLCEEARYNEFKAVCVPPNFVAKAFELLKNTNVKVATVVGFPFGYSNTASKLAEIQQALADGADEIDMVHNISAAKSGNWNFLSKEVALCLQPIRLKDKCLKVIIESGILTDDEIIKSCEVYAKHKVDFVKTSTGYAEIGATLHAVKLMRANLPDSIEIKASGGIRDYAFAQELIAAGATRIGASAGVKLIAEEKLANKN
jgi:deoxyribose-phosphate aldolase